MTCKHSFYTDKYSCCSRHFVCYGEHTIPLNDKSLLHMTYSMSHRLIVISIDDTIEIIEPDQQHRITEITKVEWKIISEEDFPRLRNNDIIKLYIQKYELSVGNRVFWNYYGDPTVFSSIRLQQHT